MNLFRLSLLTSLAATPVLAEHSREMAAHEHGVSQLEIAIEGGRVAMDLLSPGADIVGFEYAASSDADKDAVEAAIRALLVPENVVTLPEAAECRLAEVLVHLHADEHEHEDAHGEEDHAHDEAEHDEHEHEDEAHEGAEHSEFHARYQFDCAHPEALTALAFPFFTHFANAQEIEARYVTEAGAGSAEIPRGAAELTLD